MNRTESSNLVKLSATQVSSYRRLSSNTAPRRHPTACFPNATSSASHTVRTNTNTISFRISNATSCSTSFLFAHGRITFVICARCAPRTWRYEPVRSKRSEEISVYLLLDPPDRGHTPSKGNLTSHRDVRRHTSSSQQRHESTYLPRIQKRHQHRHPLRIT